MNKIRYNVNIVQKKRGDILNNIKQLRENANLTQQQLSENLNVDRSTIAKWETGEAMPRADKLPELAKIFGCSIDDLYSA